MANKRDLKAYVRYDANGRLIAGSLILQRFKPKVGNWQEIQAYECCNFIPTTSTTSTTTTAVPIPSELCVNSNDDFDIVGTYIIGEGTMFDYPVWNNDLYDIQVGSIGGTSFFWTITGGIDTYAGPSYSSLSELEASPDLVTTWYIIETEIIRDIVVASGPC